MTSGNDRLLPFGEILPCPRSRRQALALMLGACRWMPAAPAGTDAETPVRLAISESVVGDVNLNDARAAMQIWIRQMTRELNVVIAPKLFDTTQEIQERARKGQLDAMALNVVEYRPIADVLDSRHIVSAAGEAGLEQYLILVKRNSGIRQLGDLKGRRLCTLKTPKTCVAPDWLFNILEEGHFGPAERFFSSVTVDPKFSRVVLPVFFGQVEACLTTRRGFDTMCELNPQVGKELTVLVQSPVMVVNFYIFRKNCQTALRERVIHAITSLRASTAGHQLATLFQFEELTVRDASCLASGLRIIDTAEHSQGNTGAGRRKGI